MKKLLSLFLCAAMAASLVAGCSSDQTTESSSGTADNSQQEATSSEGPEEEAAITWAVFETDNYTAEVWQHIIDTFEADNPGIKIEKVLMTGDSRPQFLKTKMCIRDRYIIRMRRLPLEQRTREPMDIR